MSANPVLPRLPLLARSGAHAERDVVRGVLPQQLRPYLDVCILRPPKVKRAAFLDTGTIYNFELLYVVAFCMHTAAASQGTVPPFSVWLYFYTSKFVVVGLVL